VETIVRGISPYVVDQKICEVIIRYPRLRWPIPDLNKLLRGKRIERVWRRGKYILFGFTQGTLILHLGMSGRLLLHSKPQQTQKHDHVDILFENGKYLRFTDPRRFGALLCTIEQQEKHTLLVKMVS